MKIEDNRAKEQFFCELKVGDVFEDCGHFYMKTKEIDIDDYTIVYNAISLSDGYFQYYEDGAQIIFCRNAKIIIDG